MKVYIVSYVEYVSEYEIERHFVEKAFSTKEKAVEYTETHSGDWEIKEIEVE